MNDPVPNHCPLPPERTDILRWVIQQVRRIWTVLRLAVKRFSRIDGTQWAAAFSYYAFFSLFPLVILFVSIASLFIDRHLAGIQIITYVENYVPIGRENQSYIFDAISGVISARGQAGIVALLILAWGSLGFIATLVRAINSAWSADAYTWWRLPLKSFTILALMVSAVLVGISIPVFTKMARDRLLYDNEVSAGVFAFLSYIIPFLMVFVSLSLFYKLAPRRRTSFQEVWAAALLATWLLQTAESLFVIYLRDYATFNAVYGAFGGIIALMMWIYLSGCILIYCACLCSAQAEWQAEARGVHLTPQAQRGV